MSRRQNARAWQMFLRLAPTSCAMAGGLIDQLGTGKLAEWCHEAVTTFDRVSDNQEPNPLDEHDPLSLVCDECGLRGERLTVENVATPDGDSELVWRCSACKVASQN